MRAETARMEVLALAVPVIARERDGVRPVFTAERDLEAPEADPFGLFGVTLRLLDLGDEARVHEALHTPVVAGFAGRAEFSREDISFETSWKCGRFLARWTSFSTRTGTSSSSSCGSPRS